MAGLLAFIGRTTIAAVLFIAAYIHLTQPNWHQEFYVQSYEYIYGIIGTSAKIGGYSIPIPAQITQHWTLVIKIVGILQGAIGILILFGDRFGEVLFGLSKIIVILLAHRQTLVKMASIKSVNDLSETHIGIFVMMGLALIFLSSPSKNSKK